MTERRATMFGGRKRALAVAALALAMLLPWTAGAASPTRAAPAPTTITFGYIGLLQTWTVPANVHEATFDVRGASGGAAWASGERGQGGRATATLPLTPGATLVIAVGEQGLGYDFWGGQPRPATYNGGGAGGDKGFFDSNSGGSGGGASDVRIGGIGLEHRVLVAGGGGGNAPTSCGPPSWDSNIGGPGGGLEGGWGRCGSGSPGNQDGLSGSGQRGQGGKGADASGSRYGGGGGGGGYYGGAGGGNGSSGGGGSGYGPAGTVFQTGVHTGHGQVTITYTADSPPSVTSVEPHAGPATGGTVVTIRGENLASPAGPTTVSFGAAPATAVSCASSTVCTATSPPGAGDVPVRVTVNGQTSTTSGSFLYVSRPTLTSVSPNQGPPGGGIEVTLTGANFVLGATSVTFGAAPATRVACSSSTSCRATSPAGTGTVQVTVTTSFGTSNGVPFTYTSPPTPSPTVTAIGPAGGPAAGGTRVLINGTDFSSAAGATTIAFGANPATAVSCISTTTCYATSPAGTGVVGVRVTVNGRQSADTPADDFTYTTAPPTTAYRFSGFLPPVDNPPAVNIGKAGRTYPVKWWLKDATGAYVTRLGAVASITSRAVACGAFVGDPAGAPQATAAGGGDLRYDSAANQYVYTWATPWAAGCYTLVLTLDTGQAFRAFFILW